MMVQFKGKGCRGCPFFHETHTPDGDVDYVWCALDDMETFDDRKLDIKLGRDGKRKGDCPFIGEPGQIEVGCYE
jgi:hypothetical protein